jgi:hypothetical protein
MTSYKEDKQPRCLAETLYNKKHRRGRSVVENAFGLKKENWFEILNKSTLDVAFLLDAIHACCILHNLTIQRGIMDMKLLLHRIS